MGARWSKLAINCAISSLGTVGGERLGVLMRHRFVRRLALEIMTETVLVARALGVRLEKVSGTLDLDWIALTDAERVSAGSPGLVAKHALLLAVGARFRRLRSSMLAAIERGRAALRRLPERRGRDAGRRARRAHARSTPPSATRCWPSRATAGRRSIASAPSSSARAPSRCPARPSPPPRGPAGRGPLGRRPRRHDRADDGGPRVDGAAAAALLRRTLPRPRPPAPDRSTRGAPHPTPRASMLRGLRCEILSTGDEVLTGQIADTNAAFLADQLGSLGFVVARHTTVGDDRAMLAAAFRELGARADIVLCTGGLGPTLDDLTTEVAADVLGVGLKLDEAALAYMEGLWSRRGRTMPENNRRQALLPEPAEVLPNPDRHRARLHRQDRPGALLLHARRARAR